MMTEKATTAPVSAATAPMPCLRSHDLSRFPPSKSKGLGQVPVDEEILRLVQQMPTLLCPSEKGEGEWSLKVPLDIDPSSAAALEASWFVNIVVTITDRNGCVIYHEA